MLNLTTNCWKIGFIGPISQNTMFQLLEIKSIQMAAVVMNVIFTTYFSISRDIYSHFDLQRNYTFGSLNV